MFLSWKAQDTIASSLLTHFPAARCYFCIAAAAFLLFSTDCCQPQSNSLLQGGGLDFCSVALK